MTNESSINDDSTTPMLMRQLSGYSRSLLNRAFAKLDVNNSGTITSSEAIEFYKTFCNNEKITVTSQLLKASAEQMIKNFDELAGDNKEISYIEWLNFFNQLKIDDKILENILQDFI